jgi:hypothetical protein
MIWRKTGGMGCILLFALALQLSLPTGAPVKAQPAGQLAVVTLFAEDFSDNQAGWTLDTEWAIGPAAASSCQQGVFPDPATDHSASADNGVAGVMIGGCAMPFLHDYYYLTSPVINTSTVLGPLYLEFYRWLNSASLPSMHNLIQVWNGSSWVSIWGSGFPPPITDAAWTRVTYELTPYKNDSMRVRFGYKNISEGSFISSWNIDDVRIYTDDAPPTAQNSALSLAEDHRSRSP